MKFTDDRVHDLFGSSLIATFVDCPVLRQAVLGIKVKNDRAIHPGGAREGEWGPKDRSVLGRLPESPLTSEAMQCLGQ